MALQLTELKNEVFDMFLRQGNIGAGSNQADSSFDIENLSVSDLDLYLCLFFPVIPVSEQVPADEELISVLFGSQIKAITYEDGKAQFADELINEYIRENSTL